MANLEMLQRLKRTLISVGYIGNDIKFIPRVLSPEDKELFESALMQLEVHCALVQRALTLYLTRRDNSEEYRSVLESLRDL